MPREFDDIKDGTVIEPYHFNIIYRELRRLRKMTAGGNIAISGMDSSTSPPSIYMVSGMTGSLGKSNGTITAGSTNTFGTGNVLFYYRDGSTPTLTGQSETVYNVSNSISTDKWVWVQKDKFGTWFVAPLECE